MEEYFTNLDFPWNSRISRNQLATNLGGPKTSCFRSRANLTRYIIIQNVTVDGLGIRRWLTHPFFGREVGSWNLPLIYDGFVVSHHHPFVGWPPWPVGFQNQPSTCPTWGHQKDPFDQPSASEPLKGKRKQSVVANGKMLHRVSSF